MTPMIYSILVETLSGKKETLETYKGKVMLIVNTASECGYTSQYEGLEKIYKKYAEKGFVILGFPSNDFGAQEPGSNAEIKTFCEKRYKVTFPMYAKNHVGGKDQTGKDQTQPLYQFLLKNSPANSSVKGAVGWNFEKFLVSRTGAVVGRFKSGVTPESAELTSAIENELKATEVQKH